MPINFGNSNPFTSSSFQMGGGSPPAFGGVGAGASVPQMSGAGVQPYTPAQNSVNPWWGPNPNGGFDDQFVHNLWNQNHISPFGSDLSDWRQQRSSDAYDRWLEKKNQQSTPAQTGPTYDPATMGNLASSYQGLFVPKTSPVNNPFMYF